MKFVVFPVISCRTKNTHSFGRRFLVHRLHSVSIRLRASSYYFCVFLSRDNVVQRILKTGGLHGELLCIIILPFPPFPFPPYPFPPYPYPPLPFPPIPFPHIPNPPFPSSQSPFPLLPSLLLPPATMKLYNGNHRSASYWQLYDFVSMLTRTEPGLSVVGDKAMLPMVSLTAISNDKTLIVSNDVNCTLNFIYQWWEWS